MQEKLVKIREEALAKLNAAGTAEALNEIRLAYLGKKGQLTEVLKGMRDVAPEDRPKVGEWVNSTRKAIEDKLAAVQKEIGEKALEARLKAETVDVTLPAKLPRIGHRHPNTIALEELERVFIGMGYEVDSNKEHGLGRPDIKLTDWKHRRVLILEAKKSDKKEQMERDCADALDQITKQEYAANLDGFEVFCYGVAFHKKSALVKKL